MTFAIYSRPFAILRRADGRAYGAPIPDLVTNCRQTANRCSRHASAMVRVIDSGAVVGCAARSGARWVKLPVGPPDVEALYMARQRQFGLVELPGFEMTIAAARAATERYDNIVFTRSSGA